MFSLLHIYFSCTFPMLPEWCASFQATMMLTELVEHHPIDERTYSFVVCEGARLENDFGQEFKIIEANKNHEARRLPMLSTEL